MEKFNPNLQVADKIVILVDDQAIVAKLIQKMLVDCNDISFHYCPDSTTALREIENIRPTTVLLDLFMPEVNGIDLLRQLRRNKKTALIPVVMLSTEENPVTKKDAFEEGANDYLVKLPDKAELIARLRYHSKAYIHRVQRDEIFEALQKAQIELEKQNIELLHLSQMDGMTGMVNRRHFEEKILIESKRAIRNKASLGLVMLDIDYFKLYNDTYGHLQGDECLIKVAKAISKQVKRPADLVARYGGEEFVLLLPETDMAGTLKVANDVWQVIERLEIPHQSSLAAKYVTVSLGAFSCIPKPGDTPEKLLQQTDAFLYQAKEEGRNRVCHPKDL